MNGIPQPLLLGQGRVMDMGREFRGDAAMLSTNDVLMGIGALVGAGLFFWLLKVLRNRQDRKRTINSPRRLFRALCKLHGVSGRERALLRRTAAMNALKHPAQLFVMPDLLSSKATQLPPKQAAEITALRDKLFGDLSTAA